VTIEIDSTTEMNLENKLRISSLILSDEMQIEKVYVLHLQVLSVLFAIM
jgi:hypothetical protein